MENQRTLNSPVLVLNRAFTAIGTTSVKNSICDLMRKAVKGLCPESFQLYTWEEWIADTDNSPKVSSFIKAAGDKLVPAPEIVVCTNYSKLHKKTLYLGSRTLYVRDDFTCRYCRQRKRAKDLSIDHIIPKSRETGNTSWENCITACKKCNQFKGNRTPSEAGFPPIKPKPKQPKWSPVAHIASHARLDSWNSFVHSK